MTTEADQVAAVFGIDGDLMPEPWTPEDETGRAWTFHHWTEYPPEWAEKEHHDDGADYRTVLRSDLFGAPPAAVTDGRDTWRLVATYSDSGERECPWRDQDTPAGAPCLLCEAGADEPHGYVYIGDGWAEHVYRLASHTPPEPDGWACTDCAHLIANGETPPDMDEDETAAYLAGITELWSFGGPHAEACPNLDAAGRWTGAADCHCERDDFSSRRCDVCRRPNNAGSRHAVTLAEPGRYCPSCSADIIGNDPHAPTCPTQPESETQA